MNVVVWFIFSPRTGLVTHWQTHKRQSFISIIPQRLAIKQDRLMIDDNRRATVTEETNSAVLEDTAASPNLCIVGEANFHCLNNHENTAMW